MPPPEDKKKRSSSKAPAKSKATSRSSSTTESRKAVPALAPREGTSANLVLSWGSKASMLENPAMVEELLEGVIPPADKEEVEKLNLDWAISKFFHIVGQVAI